MATIYRKTAAGYAEIESRANKLLPRVRSALIMVDGRHTDEELRRLIPQQADASLIALLERGLIEAVGSVPDGTSLPTRPAPLSTAPAPLGASSRPAALSRPAPLPASAPAPLSAPLPFGAAGAARPLESLKRELVRALTDQVGPLAEALALRIERARSAEELQPLLDVARQVVGNTRGQRAALEFASRFGDLGR